ncbi:hypothetical protein [Chromobacterium haemolyticum]|uniref:hypothetical protein n=1 Tax=Chromobacterium haemolyticum TaxID=394935 RepID=UPI00244ADA00|nr:hypothetical protein [Chromobacterium haemolyticum]MDH0342072.1 hypothetical protein [Chromobacterium haemolyticum]
MTTKQEAQDRITSACRQCEKVQATWTAATASLKGSVRVNGYGIFHDRGEPVRQLLLDARQKIDQALSELQAIDWPTNNDYDQV